MSQREEQLRTLVDDYAAHTIDRREFGRRTALLGLSVGAAEALLGAAAAAARPQAAPTTLNVRYDIDIANIDPAFRPALEDEQIGYCVYEQLVSYKPGSFELVNTLAESFEPSSNHLSYHFKLK